MLSNWANAQVPTITSISPTSAAVGATVTITGTNFNTTASNNIVYFGSVRATVTNATATQLRVTVPLGATNNKLVVTNLALSKSAMSNQTFLPSYNVASLNGSSFIPGNSISATGSPSIAKNGIQGAQSSYSIIDHNLDGKPDVLHSLNGSVVSIAINNSASNAPSDFSNYTNFQSSIFTHRVASSFLSHDFTNDGKLDIVSAEVGQQGNFITNTSSNVSNLSYTAPSANGDLAHFGWPVAFDFNNDGLLDAFGTYSIHDGYLRYLTIRNSTTSSSSNLTATTSVTSASSYHHAKFVYDVNSDGFADVVSGHQDASNNNGIALFRSSGTGTFTRSTAGSLSGIAVAATSNDLNADGNEDFIFVTNAGIINIYPNNTVANATTLTLGTRIDLTKSGSTFNGGAFADLNGDNKLDIVVSDGGGLHVFLNTSSGSTISFAESFQIATFSSSSNSLLDIEVVDMSGDGKIEIIGKVGSALHMYKFQLPPTISVSGALTSFSKCGTTASTSQSFTASGANLMADITVTAPTGFEVSLSAGTGYASSVTLTRSGTSVSATTIYVRMKSDATGSPSGPVRLTSTNATAVDVSASGTVSTIPTAPTGVPGSRIGTGVVNLSATVAAGNTVDWYATNTSTSALLAGSLTFTTPSISQTTNYFAQARGITSGCVSTRTQVTATVGVFTCPTINRRNNGNGQANRCPGVDGTAMHASVVNTAYATVPTTQKTGDISFQYASAPAVIPVITKIWIEGAISNVQAGPPSLYDVSTRRVEYCFYNSNLPNSGRYTLEFTNPQTGEVVARCTYDGSSNVAATEPNNLSTLSVLSFTPTTAKSGETVTITGTDFTGATSVKIGGVEVRSFTVVNATTIIAVVAANATVDNNVSVTTAGGTASASGFTFSCVSNALDFDGTDDFVQMGAPMPLSGSDNFTIEAWVKPAAIDGAYHGFFGGNASGGSWPPSMWVAPSGQLYAFSSSSTGNHTMFISNFFTANKWTHVAWVKNGANFIVYKNGVQAGTLTANTTLTYPSANFFLGRVDNYLNGALDEVRIWNVARTQQEISDNMGIDIAANVTGLVAYYNFNQGTAAGNNATITTLNNLTSNTALNGTLTNIVRTGSRSNFVAGASPVIITQPAATLSVCGNVSTGNTLTVSAAGQQLTYQWYRNTTNSNVGGTAINGATAASYAVPTNTAGDFYYYVVVTDCSVNETSSVSAVTVIPASVAGAISGSASVCANQNATVTTSTSYLDGVTNATNGGNNRGQSFTTGVTPGALNNIKLTIWPVGTPYLVLREWVSDNYANAFDGAIIATSNTATNMPSTSNWENPSTFVFPTKPYLEANTKYVFQVMNGEPYVKIPGAYAGGAAFETLNPTTVRDMQFSINLHGAVASTPLTLSGYTGTIQWQSSSDNSTWANIAGATSATYTHNEYVISGSNIVKYFRAVVTNSTCTPATTSTFTHTVNPPSVAGTASTTTSAICSGTTASLTLTGATGSVQWQSSTDNTTWTNITNASTANYTTPVLTQTTYFRAAVTSGACTSVNSNTITVTVTNPPVAATLTGTQAICVGATTQLSAAGEGGALAFNGTNNFVSTASNISALNITGDITVETWIKVNQLPNDWVRIIGKGDASARTYGFWLAGDGSLLWQIYGAGGFDLFTSARLQVGRWHHIAASRIGNVHTIYIDGVASGTLTQSVQPATNTLPLTLGYSGFHTYLNGVLDEVRVWNVGRTATQINANKDIEIAPQSGLVAYYKMNQGTAGANNAGLTTVNDNSGNNYNGTLNNFTLTGNNSNWVSRTSAAPSGTWATSDASIATVSNSGLVTGIAAGTATITFTVAGSGGCADAVSTRAVTVTAAPQAGTLSGTQSICVGSNTTFTSTVTGGTWSSSTSSVATVNSAGVVTGVAAGTATITYTVVGSGGCADAIVTRTVTVSAAPVSGSIRGTQNVCIAGATQFTAVAPGNGLDFDGNDDHATLPAGVYFDDNTYTIEGWVYIRSHANWHRLIDFGNGASNHNVLIALSRGTSGQPALHMYNGTSVYQLNATPVLPLNQWVHIAAVRDNNNAYMYVDGVLIASANDVNVNTAAITRNNNFIGKSNWSDANSNVAMSDLRIWNVARSQSQIANNMNAELSQQSGLIFNLKFNDGTPNENNTGVTTLTDESGSGTNATLRNFALTGNRSNFVSRTNTTVGTGTWTSSNTAVATVDANSGLVTGVAAGTATITYTVAGSGGCADAVSTRAVTVTAPPVAGSLSGEQAICVGATTTFTSSQTGGTWSTSDANIATVNTSTGVVTGVAAGTATITYTVAGSGGCSNATVTRTVTVTAAPVAATLAGTQNVCLGGTTQFSASDGTPGVRGTAMNFDGVNDEALIPDNSTLDITNAITIEAWVYPTKNSGIQNVLSKSSTGPNDGYIFPRTDNGWQEFVFYLHVGGGWRTVSFPYPALNTWHHLAATYDGSRMRIYLNGNLVNSLAVTGTITTNNNFLAIGNQPGFGEFFGGNVDELRLWNVARTQAQIAANKDIEIAAQSNLIAYFNFNQGVPGQNNSGITNIQDASGNGFNAAMGNRFALNGQTSNFITYGTGGGASTTSGTWTTSDPTIATVNASGLVTGVAAGTATITYTVAGSGGCSNAVSTRTITVNPLPAIAYGSASYRFERTKAITAFQPTSTGATVTGYTITPTLPAGLSFNTTTGAISGTPTAVVAAATYTVTATSAAGCTSTASFTLATFNAVAPSGLTYNPASQTVRRGTAITNMVPTATGDPIETYTISPALPAGITINATTGIIGGTLTEQVTGSVTYTVTGANTGGTATATVTLIYNTAPTDIDINPSAVPENEPTGTAVGTLSTTDVDQGDTHTYTLVSGTGDTDNASFTIDGNTLKTNAVFDFETKTSYSIRIRTTDAGGLSYEEVFTITVTDVDEDNDGDGVMDSKERQDGTDPFDRCSFILASQTVATSSAWKAADCDNDGLTNQQELDRRTNPLVADTDGDGVIDGKEVSDNTDPLDHCSFVLASQTVATSSAWKAADCDSDGLTNQQELDRRTNPLIADTDGDGVIDGKEVSDGTNPLDQCSFILASQTVATSSAWKAADCDNDGLTNQQELDRRTNPLVADTDGDGVIDGKEVSDGTNPLDQCSFVLASQTVEPSTAWKAADCDNDGLTNQQEKDRRTDPLKADTDGDGVIDGKEVSDGTNPLDQCSYRMESQTLTPSNAWLNGDCNGDGIRNGQNLLISMYATAPQLQSDGSFNLKYIIKVQNLRPERVTISGIQKNLTNTFRLPTTFRVTGVRGTSTGHLLAAASYDGRTQLNVVSTGSGIGGYTLDSVTIDVNVVPNGFSGSVQSTATLTGTGAFGFTLNTPSTDVTVTGGSFPAGGAPTPTVIPVVTYIIPDAFSPNRDGINDRFVVIRPYQSVISLQVFNRWGNVVYRSDNYNNEWDGRGMSQYGGGDLPEGTYFYLIRSREQSGEVKQFRGSIMLKR